MDERGLAPATIDRRLSTVCGYYRFAHIDGRITGHSSRRVFGAHLAHPRSASRSRSTRVVQRRGAVGIDVGGMPDTARE
jgi:hypothetical protein